MLKSAVPARPSILLAGNDPLLEPLSSQLGLVDVQVTLVAAHAAVEKVWMAAPQLVVAVGDAVTDGGDGLRDALLAEPASAGIPLLLVRRGRIGRDFKSTATIAPILGANRIAMVIAQLAEELLANPRTNDAQPLQRHVSATLHRVERQVTFERAKAPPMVAQIKAPTRRRTSTHLSMAPPPVDALGGPQHGLAWTKPPRSKSSQNLRAAQVPEHDRLPAQPSPSRTLHGGPSLQMDPNFGAATTQPTPAGGPPHPTTAARRPSDQTMVGLGDLDSTPTSGPSSHDSQETPTVRPPATSGSSGDLWEAEDAFADLGEELGTERKSGPSIEHSGMRVLDHDGSDSSPKNPHRGTG